MERAVGRLQLVGGSVGEVSGQGGLERNLGEQVHPLDGPHDSEIQEPYQLGVNLFCKYFRNLWN